MAPAFIGLAVCKLDDGSHSCDELVLNPLRNVGKVMANTSIMSFQILPVQSLRLLRRELVLWVLAVVVVVNRARSSEQDLSDD